MVNYQLGKIYKIVSKNKTYYGSTCELSLSRRLSKHIYAFKAHMVDNSKTYISSFEVFKDGFYDIVLVELYPCNNKDELHARERFYVENNECVNQHIPNRTNKEYREANKEHIKENKANYYAKNKEMFSNKNKQYCIDNKEQIAIQKKKSYENNKEFVLKKCKEYRETHKESIQKQKSQRFICECGADVRWDGKSIHFKSLLHQNFTKEKANL